VVFSAGGEGGRKAPEVPAYRALQQTSLIALATPGVPVTLANLYHNDYRIFITPRLRSHVLLGHRVQDSKMAREKTKELHGEFARIP
jgi:hypothetical protein